MLQIVNDTLEIAMFSTVFDVFEIDFVCYSFDLLPNTYQAVLVSFDFTQRFELIS